MQIFKELIQFWHLLEFLFFKEKIKPLKLLAATSSFGRPWTWNLVLITSKGQTNVAAITPESKLKKKASVFQLIDLS